MKAVASSLTHHREGVGSVRPCGSAQVAVEVSSFSVISPAIIAVGKGDRRAEWVIEDAAGLLIGDQELYLTVLTPIVADEIRMSVRISATVATFDLLPCLLQTEPVELRAALE